MGYMGNSKLSKLKLHIAEKFAHKIQITTDNFKPNSDLILAELFHKNEKDYTVELPINVPQFNVLHRLTSMIKCQ
jgi:hypothetical protein